MRMLLVFVPSDCLEDVQELMDRHEVHAYTEVPHLLGSGQGGRKLGTRAFPGTSSLLTFDPEKQVVQRMTWSPDATKIAFGASKGDPSILFGISGSSPFIDPIASASSSAITSRSAGEAWAA